VWLGSRPMSIGICGWAAFTMLQQRSRPFIPRVPVLARQEYGRLVTVELVSSEFFESQTAGYLNRLRNITTSNATSDRSRDRGRPERYCQYRLHDSPHRPARNAQQWFTTLQAIPALPRFGSTPAFRIAARPDMRVRSSQFRRARSASAGPELMSARQTDWLQS